MRKWSSAVCLGKLAVKTVLNIVSVSFGLLVAANSPGQDGQKPSEEMQGTWDGVAAQAQGGKGGFTTVWEIKADKIIATLKDRKSEHKYRIDSAKNPRRPSGVTARLSLASLGPRPGRPASRSATARSAGPHRH
jgi:hypothetical protein